MREAQWEFIMSTTDRNGLPVCRKCRLPLSFRCTETVARAGACEILDLFECAECGRLAAFARTAALNDRAAAASPQ